MKPNAESALMPQLAYNLMVLAFLFCTQGFLMPRIPVVFASTLLQYFVIILIGYIFQNKSEKIKRAWPSELLSYALRIQMPTSVLQQHCYKYQWFSFTKLVSEHLTFFIA